MGMRRSSGTFGYGSLRSGRRGGSRLLGGMSTSPARRRVSDWRVRPTGIVWSLNRHVGGAVFGDRGEVEVGGGGAGGPGLPEEEALAVAAEGGDEVMGGGEGAELAVGAEVLGDQVVVPAQAEDGAF